MHHFVRTSESPRKTFETGADLTSGTPHLTHSKGPRHAIHDSLSAAAAGCAIVALSTVGAGSASAVDARNHPGDTDPAGDAQNRFHQNVASADVLSFDISLKNGKITYSVQAAAIDSAKTTYYVGGDEVDNGRDGGAVSIAPGGVTTFYPDGGGGQGGAATTIPGPQASYDRATNTVSVTFKVDDINSRHIVHLAPSTEIAGAAAATTTGTGLLGLGGDAKDSTSQFFFTLGG